MEQETTNRLKEQNAKLLSDMLERNYYKFFTRDNSEKDLEFIINRKNKISTCYGCFNNDETLMYPNTDFSVNDYDKIKANLATFLKFYIKKEWKPNIVLTGIDWTNDFDVAKSILDTIFNTFEDAGFTTRPQKITINTDASFIIPNNDLMLAYNYYHGKFKEQSIDLVFNIYRDGLVCDNDGWTEAQYNTLFDFTSSLGDDVKFITYLKAKDIEKWNDNYNWWISKLGKDCFEKVELREQKNTEWARSLLDSYMLFLNHQVDVLNLYFTEEECNHIYFGSKKISFTNIAINDNQYTNNLNNNNNCGLFKNLTIDLTSMNIVPCGKVNYKDFANGTYIIKDGEITGYEGKNIPMMIYSTHLKQMCMPHCENCYHVDMCSGHCLGESYNKCYDLLVPIREFCDLTKVRINFLIYRYDQMGLINKDKLVELGCRPQHANMIILFRDKITGGEAK